MAQGNITVTVDVIYPKKRRVVSVGEWKRGVECPHCGYLNNYRPNGICPQCGVIRPLWKEVAVRWIIRKTGFWFWQIEGHHEKKA